MANKLNITSDDLELTYEDFDGSLVDWYDQKIDEATRLLLVKVPSLQRRIADGLVDYSFVKDTVLKAVMRVVRNTKGMTSVGEDGLQIAFNTNVSSGDLWYSKAELQAIAPVKTRAVKRYSTVQMNRW